MTTIAQLKFLFKGKLDPLDLDLIIADSVRKPREFVLAHPEHEITKRQEGSIKNQAERRVGHEPLAYILKHKEFFGLDFAVDNNVLIPRPETEQIVELVLEKLKAVDQKTKTIIDVGTGSGNIIISLAKNLKQKNIFYGVDISGKALRVAKRNSKENKVEKKIKFIKSNLLNYFSKHSSLIADNFFIIANLPYLSKEIYSNAPSDVKNFEPQSALLSDNEGVAHYEKLLKQIKEIKTANEHLLITIFLEISPEQKNKMNNIAKSAFLEAKIKFHKDLAGKWRVLEAEI